MSSSCCCCCRASGLTWRRLCEGDPTLEPAVAEEPAADEEDDVVADDVDAAAAVAATAEPEPADEEVDGAVEGPDEGSPLPLLMLCICCTSEVFGWLLLSMA